MGEGPQGLVALAVTFLGTLFLYSAVAKWLSLASFIQTLHLIPYLPHQLARPIGLAVPLVEIITAVSLILGYAWAKWLAIVMLCAFSLVAFVAHSRNVKIPCNCFGTDTSEFLSLGTVVRNASFVALTAISIAVPHENVGVLSATYGMIAFLLFMIVNKTFQIHREFVASNLGS